MTQEKKPGLVTDHADKEMSRLEVYAKAHGVGVDEAGLHLLRSALIEKFCIKHPATAQVLHFKRKRCVEQVE